MNSISTCGCKPCVTSRRRVSSQAVSQGSTPHQFPWLGVGAIFFASNLAAPFGGRHESGLGTEYGPEGLAAYLSYKSIHRKAR